MGIFSYSDQNHRPNLSERFIEPFIRRDPLNGPLLSFANTIFASSGITHWEIEAIGQLRVDKRSECDCYSQNRLHM